MKSWKIESVIELEPIAAELVSSLDKPSLIWIEGEVGAGKTTFIKSLIRALRKKLGATASDKEVSSPTFSVHNIYDLGAFNFHHFDFYRLKSESDLESIGFWESLNELNSMVCIEWPQKLLEIEALSGRQLVLIKIEFLKEIGRKISFTIKKS